MAGDYTTYQHTNTAKVKNQTVLATDATAQLAGVLTPKSANHQLWIQSISVLPTTSAAQALTFQDSASTPVKIGTFPASTATPLFFDYGSQGWPLTTGKQLDIICSAGVACSIHIEAYEKLVGPIAQASTN